MSIMWLRVRHVVRSGRVVGDAAADIRRGCVTLTDGTDAADVGGGCRSMADDTSGSAGDAERCRLPLDVGADERAAG
jgi:hypothetical protein